MMDGAVLDPAGKHTTDPSVMYTQPRGVVLPFGEHKGSGLALACELLDKFVPQLKETGGEEVPLETVSGKIRELLTQEKVNELMVSWLQTLRSESKVIVPSAAASAEGVQAQ